MGIKYGDELIKQLEHEIELHQKAIDSRWDRINDGSTDLDDCFISERCDERARDTARDKIRLIKDGGCSWFIEYATLDGQLVKAKWCYVNNYYGYGKVNKLRVEFPDGSVKWTTATTTKGLAKIGLKKVLCKRPAWYCFRSSNSGMLGVYTGSYDLFPSDYNYSTGEPAGLEPLEIKDYEEA